MGAANRGATERRTEGKHAPGVGVRIRHRLVGDGGRMHTAKAPGRPGATSDTIGDPMQRRTSALAQLWSTARLAAAVSWWALQPVPGPHVIHTDRRERS